MLIALLKKILDAMVESRQQQAEKYLSKSVDLYDLESRQRELQKRGML